MICSINETYIENLVIPQNKSTKLLTLTPHYNRLPLLDSFNLNIKHLSSISTKYT